MRSTMAKWYEINILVVKSAAYDNGSWYDFYQVVIVYLHVNVACVCFVFQT